MSRPFKSHDHVFSGLSADALAALTTVNSDVSVILSADGEVLDVAYRDPSVSEWAIDDWVGRLWRDTVTADSVEKIDDLLLESASVSPTRSRQVNHPGNAGRNLPMGYRVVSFVGSSYRIAFGTDLRAMAEMQQRLVMAHIEMEKDYRKLRDIESRYRVLFHLAVEPLIVVDGQALKILDVNEGAARLLSRPVGNIVGLSAQTVFAKDDQSTVADSLRAVGASARADVFRARLSANGQPITVNVMPFRELGKTILLVRMTSEDIAHSEETESGNHMVSVVESLPEGVVIVNAQGSIIQANPAFLDLIRVVTLDRIEGKGLDNWLGGSTVDLQVLMANLREHRTMRRFSSVIRDSLGGVETVEVSAATISSRDGPLFGFSIREAPRIEAVQPGFGSHSGGTTSQLTDLVGRVPLKNLVRDTADIIEKLCIEAALRLTENNRASAADMLGLSRQSLYLKLKRFGISEFDPGEK